MPHTIKDMPTDARVDRYIASAPAFARPILEHLRALVHEGCPEIAEDVKWSRPAFIYQGKILFGMSAFKAHCSFGFWNLELNKQLAASGVKAEEAAGSLGRVTSLRELPSDRELLSYIREAVRRVKEPAPTLLTRKSAAPKPELTMPADFESALTKSKAAAHAFESFSASHRREYLEWILEAKRDETRQKRIATALEWLEEGKPRNWKYMNC